MRETATAGRADQSSAARECAWGIRLGSAGAVAGRDVVLVDDVYRMGTTMTECAQVLRRAGTTNVSVARTAKLASKFEGLDLPGGGWAKFQGFEFQRQNRIRGVAPKNRWKL